MSLLGGTLPASAEIAFLRLANGYWQVWTMGDDGSHQRQVTFDATDKSKMAWYPNGKTLLYSTNLGTFFKVSVDKGEAVKPRPVKIQLVDAVASASFGLSPDARKLAIATNTLDMNIVNDLWIFDLSHHRRERIQAPGGVSLNSPTFTPDGKVLVYREAYAYEDVPWQRIKWREVNGKKGGTLVGDFPFNFDQVAAPNGVVAFSSSRSGHYEIWTVFPREKPRELTHLGAFTASPSWSPDGRSIAFESDKSGRLEIWVMKADGSGMRELTHGPDESRRPIWGGGKVR